MEFPMLFANPSGQLAFDGRRSVSPTQVCRSIAALVAAEFGLDAATLMSSTRGAPRAAYARQVAMYLAHVGYALSFESIGRAFDRDRTTVSHACRVVEDSRDDGRLDRRLAILETTCAAFDEGLEGAPDAGL
jgi:chromosomal replication initiation ATPase DnaA